MLEDIAVSTGGTAIMEGSGVENKSVSRLKEPWPSQQGCRQQGQDTHRRRLWRRP